MQTRKKVNDLVRKVKDKENGQVKEICNVVRLMDTENLDYIAIAAFVV